MLVHKEEIEKFFFPQRNSNDPGECDDEVDGQALNNFHFRNEMEIALREKKYQDSAAHEYNCHGPFREGGSCNCYIKKIDKK